MNPGTIRPRLQVPPGACDTHTHFYHHRYKSAPTAVFTPPDAWVDDYRKVRERTGLQRVVVVQPTVYGLDNQATLDAIAALGSSSRGVAAVPASISDADLDRLTRCGIRGARLHMLAGGALPWEAVDTVPARVQDFGWHCLLQFDGREFADREATVKRIPGMLVIDHNGKFLEPVSVDHPSFRALLRLLENGRTWVKVAAPYETSKLGPPDYKDVGVLAKALIRAAPDRVIWASNWPHPASPPRVPAPDEGALLDLLLEWAPDDATRRKILVDNPARLYGF